MTDIKKNKHEYDGVSICAEKIIEHSWSWNEGVEVIFVFSGIVTAEIHKDPEELIRLELDSGCIYIFGVGEIHRVYSNVNNSIMRLKISKERIYKVIGECRFLEFDIPEITMSDKERFLLTELKERSLLLANSVIENNDSFTQNKDLSEEIDSFILFIFNNFEIVTRKMIRANQSEMRESMVQAADYIREYFSEKNVLTGLSNTLYMDSGYISRIMKTKLDYNYQQLINFYRTEKAIRMLLSTDDNMSMISADCGFSATRYFYKEFSKFYPKGPRDFRRKYKEFYSKAEILDAKEEIHDYLHINKVSTSNNASIPISLDGKRYFLSKNLTANTDERFSIKNPHQWYIKENNEVIGITYVEWLEGKDPWSK